MKGIIRNKHLYIVVAVIAVLACLLGAMQIKSLPSENAISGVVYGSELDQWKDSGYTLATGAMEAVNKYGPFGALFGGISKAAAGISAAILFGLLNALIFQPKAKSN
jgi:hypothetical protein